MSENGRKKFLLRMPKSPRNPLTFLLLLVCNL